MEAVVTAQQTTFYTFLDRSLYVMVKVTYCAQPDDEKVVKGLINCLLPGYRLFDGQEGMLSQSQAVGVR